MGRSRKTRESRGIASRKHGTLVPAQTSRATPSLGALADLFPTELNALVEFGRQVVSEIKELSEKELEAITKAGEQKAQITSGTQEAIKLLVEKLPDILQSKTQQEREERVRLVKDIVNVIDNVDHRDHEFRMQQTNLVNQEQGNTTLKLLIGLALAGVGALVTAALLNKRD